MTIPRRQFLAALPGVGLAGLSGCTALVSTTVDREPPVVAARPDGVYIPSHVEAYRAVGSATVGDLRVDLAYTYPQRAWTVESTPDGEWTTSLRTPGDSDVHLVVTVRDAETGVPLPNLSLRVAIRPGGASSAADSDESVTGMSDESVTGTSDESVTGTSAESVTETSGESASGMALPAMLAQRLGPHYGTNAVLSGDGTYRVVIRVDGTDVRRFGSFATRFDDSVEAAFEFEYSQAERDEIPFTVFERGRRGERDAVPPVVRENSRVGRVPRPLPGTPLGASKTGDARVLASSLTRQRFGTDRYLAVWLATPHNRFSLAAASLSARLVASGATRFANALRPALDPELGFHYGAAVPAVGADTDLTISVERPPQLVRHEGYETAFLEMPPVTL